MPIVGACASGDFVAFERRPVQIDSEPGAFGQGDDSIVKN
jgi:hypothetical protein